MKPSLRHAPLWLGLWLAALVAVVALSLGSPPPAPGVPNADKWQHFLTYGVLAAAAVQVFRRGTPLLLACAGVVLLGIGLEVAQGTLTATRQMDWRDAVANTAGVLLGAATVLTPLRDVLVRRGWT
ncbi:VanZ family protein [Nocardioides sp. zg-ZUI104]|uniref:VanZ family protein n=1 Tax=Nocardioides faecalis TaxID=2803858 RepID=UPI001BCFDDA1|nr:VanZ family protein [Nocardioides faecalis]MBS4753337.1 VanZ family protein [Nocardioides faecalis]